ncbi:putative P-loop containing nucleoside triphosphate hydrolase, leucine-rich repeat domain superfamily [Helianthus annuus]|nr:putative P-loop containing nucleoside triphosphate hydrolase, leucine-rich repeat domain superfamily [Helianthus annuus]
MVGIWGIGGSGKTTLASSLYKKISHHFEGHCIIDNIQVESNKHGLTTLQEKIISGVSRDKGFVQSVELGKDMIKSSLCKRKVLIVLDDVNDLDQLQALAGSHKWFGKGSLIIITTRDEHLLRSHKIDEVYRVRMLLEDEAIRLFNLHAYNEKDPIEDYDKLSLRVVSYAAGLPLALKVLGSFLYDKDKNEWLSALDKLKDIPDPKIMDILKISYDGLETYQKELFLDIACFWRWESVDDVMEILEACDFYPKIGIKVLRQKALISIVDGRFDMHDLVQEMGFYIVRGEYPKNPEKHSRVWKDEEIKNMCFGDARMEYHKIEAIRFEDYYERDNLYLLPFCRIVSNMKKLRCLMVKIKKINQIQFLSLTPGVKVEEYIEGPGFLSNELRYIDWDEYPTSPFPDSFQPTKLVVLKLSSKQKELWTGYKHLPHLKVLQLFAMPELLSTLNFDGLPCLQKLTLHCCNELEEIHPSLGTHTSLVYLSILGCYKLRRFPRIVQMVNLKTLEIKGCKLKDGEIPYGIGKLSNLQKLDLRSNDFSRLDFSLSQLTMLKDLNMSHCYNLLELPELPSNLAILKADLCTSLTTVGDCHKKCKQLCEVSVHGWHIIHNGERLLQSMLEGNAIENGSMLLRLRGVDVAKGFTPPLLRGGRCIVQLPENWDSQDDVVWEEIDNANDSQVDVTNTRGRSFRKVYGEDTLVWYVSFDSLRKTTWWDQRYKALLFRINDKNKDKQEKCSAFRVRLVDKNSRTSLTDRSPRYSHHPPPFQIKGDTTSVLTISLES